MKSSQLVSATSLLCSILALALSTESLAASSLHDWASEPDKTFFRKARLNTSMAPLKGLVKRMKIPANQLPTIGKVGVVGMTAFQTTPIDSGRVNYQMLNDAGASHLADLLYAPVYPDAQPAYVAIQAAFTERGYQLLEPVQFLDTPKKQGYFANRQFEMSGLMQAVGHLQRRAKGNPQ